MPGRLQRDFRFGNIAEHLGILLLKGVAAVADVSRPEDIGLDAIATLLRPDHDGNSYAEDTFVVQLKSESAKSIRYEGHELKWLIGQSQPMFIGVVSIRESTISLYPTVFVNHAVMSLHAEWVKIQFGASKIPAFMYGTEWSAWKGEDNHGATVWLGDPLLKWSLADILDKAWINTTYQTLKKYLSLARRGIRLLELGQFSVLKWSTNNVDSIESHFGLMKGKANDFCEIAHKCAPSLHALMIRAISNDSDSANSLMASLVNVAASLRKMGADVDPENLFGKFFFAFNKPKQNDMDEKDESASS